MQEYFWSIVVEEGFIQAAVWSIKDSSASVTHISNSATWDNDEALVTAADAALSSCVQSLPQDAGEPTKAVFGVPPSWVSDGQIVREHLDKVRLLCNKLSLTPTGFVVMPEAIAHFKKSEEKAPISAVVIGVGVKNLDVSIFRFGNLVGNVSVARSLNVFDDVVEGLARFGISDPLPSRFLLYDSKKSDLEDVRQSLIKAEWPREESRIKFLHSPQVEIVDPNDKMIAVSLAGAMEIGGGNVTDFDFGKKKKEKVPEGDFVDPSSFGFSGETKVEEVVSEKKSVVPGKFKLPFGKLNLKIGSLPLIGNIRGKVMQKRENLFFMIAIVVLVGIIGLSIAWWFLPKAQVTIVVSPKKIEGTQKITYDQSASSVDFNKLIVPAKTLSTTITLEKTRTTTGTRTIGDPAKGSVTFYNAGSALTIPSGTVLTGSNLNFTLDNDVSIASASGVASAATAKGNVTASGVGADYNLASNTLFSVGSYSSSDLQAKNDSDLSGGSSQQVTAVSKDDIDGLTSDLLAEITSNGKDQLKSNLSADSHLIDSSMVATASSKQFDHKLGEQATTVKLSMTADVSGLTVLKKDMDDFARKAFSSEVPSGFVMRDEQIDFVVNEKDTNFMINLLPEINPDDLAKRLAGKTSGDAKNILSRLPGYQDVRITFGSFPAFNFLPHISKNITVALSAK